ncbi:MAG: phosphate regulon transcriptional regulator PhoB [Hyphomicrobiaceae bacterium]
MNKLTQPLVLIVEDEPAQLEVLSYNLGSAGFRLATAMDGDEALLIVEEQNPDVIILDWMLPNVSGIEVCRRLKSRSSTKLTPIIMLTARGDESDRVRGLEIGADDYVVKPYSINELIARVRGVLRRTRPASVDETLSYGELTMDPVQHKVTLSGERVKLGPTEFRLLTTFLENPGRVWEREQLLNRVWGHESDVDLRTVDVHVGRLRKALVNVDQQSSLIRTVRGVGYSLDSEG